MVIYNARADAFLFQWKTGIKEPDVEMDFRFS